MVVSLTALALCASFGCSSDPSTMGQPPASGAPQIGTAGALGTVGAPGGTNASAANGGSGASGSASKPAGGTSGAGTVISMNDGTVMSDGSAGGAAMEIVKLEPSIRSYIDNPIVGLLAYPEDRYPAALTHILTDLVEPARMATYVWSGDLHQNLFQTATDDRYYQKNGLDETVAEWLTGLLNGKSERIGVVK